MLRWLAALLLIPLLDAILLAVFVERVGIVGWTEMVLLVVLTGLVGLLLVQAEGRRTLRTIRRKLEDGELPTNQVIDGGLLIAAGAFLLTPGLVTDVIGFALVIPVSRYPIRLGLKRYLLVPYLDAKTDGLITGEAWTEGFPGPDGSATGFQWESVAETATDGPGADRAEGRGDEGRGDEGTIDLDESDYTVDLGDVRRDEDPDGEGA